MPVTPDGIEYQDTLQGRVYTDPTTGEYTFSLPNAPAVPGPGLPAINPFAGVPAQAPGVPGGAAVPNPEALLAQLRDLVANQLVPTRQAGLLGALAQLTQLANASPQALLQASAPQRQALRRGATQARGQVARQVGPAGVGVTRRAGRDINENAYTQLAQLFGQLTGQGEQGIAGIAQGTSALVPTGRQTSSGTSTGISQQPFDPMMTALGLSGLIDLGSGLYDVFKPGLSGLFGGGTSTAPSFGSGGIGALPFF